MPRFDDRLSPRGPDGDDFQKFVWEALRSGHFEPFVAGRYIRPYYAFGNDGAIDHLAIGDHDQIVVECKFFGKERKGQPAGDWKAVAEKLEPNLLANARRGIDSVARHYKPWFDANRPIRGYWFCTSGNFQPGAQSELRQDITTFFTTIAQSHASLAHLAGLDVEVFGWNDFGGALNAIPPLSFKWFRQLPVGFRPMRSLTGGKTFRRFLDEGTLDFFSRDAFNREIGFDNQARVVDEQTTLSILLETNDQTGLVLSGPGGLGKTRLAVQFGLAAELKGWLALQVERIASPEAVDELARVYPAGARVLLIIDYAEAAASLLGLAHAMERANRDGKHQFRFVATCRASAISAVKEALEDSAYRVIEFSGRPDDRYNNWVVNKILLSADVPRLDEVASVCGGIPAIAAFAVFLSKQYPERFDSQFGQIHRGDDFSIWADKRLKLALSAQNLDDFSTRRRLATLAARLPLPANEYQFHRSLSDETTRLLDLLQFDRWIEPDGEGIAATHDIFADAIITRYVFETSATITDRVGDVLSDSMDAGAFDRAFIALNRLAAHRQFEEIDGLTAIRRAHARNPLAVIASHKLLLRIRIPNYKTSVRLLDEFPDVASAIAADASCDGLLAYLAESAAVSANEAWRNEAGRILQPLLDLAVERTQWSNIVVRRALRLLPERYRQQALGWIRREPTRSETHFIFVAWLLSGLPPDEISFDLNVWLANKGRSDLKASFVLSAWLDAAAKLDQEACLEKIGKVQDHVLAWLNEHPTKENAQFVYKSWLDAAAKLDQDACLEKIDKVQDHVLAWLNGHRTKENAEFVYDAWLDAAAKLDQDASLEKISKVQDHVLAWLNGHRTKEKAEFVYKSWLDVAAKLDQDASLEKISKVQDHVLAWLNGHRTKEKADFVYKSWLDAAAKLDQEACLEKIGKVQDHVLAWLNDHRTKEDAQFVYNAWLDAAAKLDQEACLEKIGKVQDHVLAWLNEHRTKENAQFVYKSWLDAAAKLNQDASLEKIGKVQDHFLAWLNDHRTKEDAQFVYNAWLDATAKLDQDACREKIDKVQDHVLAWIENFGATENADFLYRSWLDAGGNFEMISQACLAWFHEHATSYQSSFLVKYITQITDVPSTTLHATIRWCALFADREEVVWQATSLLIRHANSSEAVAVVRTFLANLRFLDLSRLSQRHIRSGEDGAKLAQMVLSGLGSALGVLALDECDRNQLNAVHARLLTESTIYTAAISADQIFIYPALIHNVATLLELGVLDVSRDRAALAQFANWMRAWPDDARQDLELAISKLRLAMPADLWDGIPPPRQSEFYRNSWEWKDNWQRQWDSTEDDPAGSAFFARQALAWLDKFDFAQRGWTSVWQTLWDTKSDSFVSRAVLTELAKKWLNAAAPEHPRWAIVWLKLWSAAQSSRESGTDQFLIMQAKAWLAGEGPRVEWKLVCQEIWGRSDLRDQAIEDCVRQRMQMPPDTDIIFTENS
jgi:hypothetical protein